MKIVAGPYTEYEPGQTIEIVSNRGRIYIWQRDRGYGSAWHMVGQSWLLCNKYVAQDFEGHLFVFFAKKALFCDPKIPVSKRISAFYSTCVPTVLHGAGECAFTQGMFQSLRSWELGKLRRILCLRRRPNEGWVDYMKRTGPIVAKQLKKHNQSKIQNLAMKKNEDCSLADGKLPE